MNENIEKIINEMNINEPAPTEEPYRQYYFIKKARKYVKEISKKIGRPLFMCPVTFGCQMNTGHKTHEKELRLVLN